MIKCDNIMKTYNVGGVETRALKGVTLRVEDGEFVAVMGTSGSGKSTLLNIIGGMDTATSGTYFYDDCEVTALSGVPLHLFRKDRISFVFQNFALIKQYTVWENVEIPLLARRIGAKERKKRIAEALYKVGIYEQKDKLPIHISGGQQQRCAIARAIVSKTPVILADEPTGALDAKNTDEIMDLFESINREGTTIMVVTHDLSVAQRCGRIVRIEDGLVAEDSV